MTQLESATRADVAPDYVTLFVEYVLRSVQVTSTRVQQDDTPVLGEETRARALHVLSFALRLPAAWPQTRDLLLGLAPKLEQAGYRGEWLPYLTQGLALSEQLGDGLAAAELRLHIGLLHRLQSRWQAAKELLTGSAEAFAQLGEQRGQARALNQLAYLAWQQHQHDEVQTLAHTALALLAEGDVERAMSLSALGLAAIEQHRWQEAEAHHRAALQIRTQHGDQRLMAWSLQNVGYALRGQGQYEAAIACYEEAMAMLGELNDAANRAIAQMNLGIVYSLLGNPVKALAVYALAESTFRTIGDEWHLAKVLTNQGIDYLTQREWQRAEEVLTRSANLFQRLMALSECLNALDGVGISYMEQGHYDKALAIFESVAAQLPEIKGTYYHKLLTKAIDDQLQQAKEGQKSALDQ